jgi:hypothetical protein
MQSSFRRRSAWREFQLAVLETVSADYCVAAGFVRIPSCQFFLLPGLIAGHFFVAKISVEFIIGVYIAVNGP